LQTVNFYRFDRGERAENSFRLVYSLQSIAKHICCHIFNSLLENFYEFFSTIGQTCSLYIEQRNFLYFAIFLIEWKKIKEKYFYGAIFCCNFMNFMYHEKISIVGKKEENLL
jgi:hypothetical protein